MKLCRLLPTLLQPIDLQPYLSLRTVHVVGVALIRDDRCLVAQRPAGGSLPLAWEFPGGKVEPGESPRDALVREIREELAIHIEVGEFIERGEGSVGVNRIVLDVYAGTIASGEPEALHHAALAWCTADELDALTWPEADIPTVAAVQELLRAARPA